ncbi:50S ribosomal protein L33 [Mycoplasmoides gallisepticum CA06_2006.052-5-2P]|nr:50S ribosomal protein L33 [Mycoplasmoides gallisepticum VA94_7994-1-7P]AFP76979.1 50S ribosomal protein L33 [Mycoplasmoides gallisepticum NC95_13295-2-2P]AFP77737.1 50S ribosomal protein L33 [Mycoplasmoides gallisepticum NC96_1596-4-2P]AFP78504.1 50S ribosomal protein L33 [Mycoplasmoides gallisepticum NY01_2001.047-5-1P]AFP79264.1 50S ribosomal protein L33 [Mycoplasmoides gallisepticum WI01_2001.043-13-2P]AFP80010.1 50S ribosomal protein L33 [Mycoplasmoides gallisepticum NC06_2006.080-5-2P]
MIYNNYKCFIKSIFLIFAIMRKKIILICEHCLNRNYTTTRSKLETTRLVLNKYCSSCNQKTVHKESH